MSLEAVIRETITKVLESKKYSSITEGVVVTVDKENNTCEVSREDLPQLFDVRLDAIVGASGTFTIYPKVGSDVIVGIVDGLPSDTTMLKCSIIDEVVFNGGDNGGLVKVQSLRNELQGIKDDLNSLKTIFKNWVVAPNDGGAALKTTAATWAASEIDDVDIDALQNEKFKH